MSDEKPKNRLKDVSSLTEEERRRLEEKFGIEFSLEEIEKQLDKSRRRIKEIERRAKRKR